MPHARRVLSTAGVAISACRLARQGTDPKAKARSSYGVSKAIDEFLRSGLHEDFEDVRRRVPDLSRLHRIRQRLGERESQNHTLDRNRRSGRNCMAALIEREFGDDVVRTAQGGGPSVVPNRRWRPPSRQDASSCPSEPSPSKSIPACIGPLQDG